MNLPSLPTLMRVFVAALFLALALLVGALRVGAQPAPDADEPPPSASDDGHGNDNGYGSDEEDAAGSRATSFRAVDGAVAEDVPGGMMLVGAYGVIAVLLLLFLFRQQSQLRELDGRITSLRSEIERGASQKDNERR